ncbi:MAG: tetratricopeptide repeat protein [Coriobacteriia bacterium]|nr:tetratricopeptide repeat protein [Coriobacteriia bacterium]
MDQTRLEAAEAAYAAGDWTTAAREYLGAAAGETQGSGYAFHRAGNALMKLKRLDDACAVYDRAMLDDDYPDGATVSCNLGTAKVSRGTYDEAARAFQRALDDTGYAARYKALQGLGGAFYEMGRIEDSAEAYRQAALDGGNPDPGKALNNLGLCFVALDRSEDAVEAYRAAVELPGYKGRGRAAANLGMAYASLGLHDRAVASFERSRDELGHTFSPSVDAAYRASLAALGSTGPALESDRVEGWTTGEMAPVPSAKTYDFTDDSDEDVERFFSRTDTEMKVADRDARRRERSERPPKRAGWVTGLMWAALAVVVVAGLAGGYLYGLGYPTQQMTVNGVMEAYADGDDVTSYWVAVPATDVEKAMSSLPTEWVSYEIGGVERSARTSKVDVTVTLDRGGVVTYQVSLAREGVGWKVNGVSTSFNSMDGGV